MSSLILTDEAIAALREVKEKILAEPRCIDMGVWRDNGPGLRIKPPCGTVACIGGWLELQHTKRTGEIKDAYWILSALDASERRDEAFSWWRQLFHFFHDEALMRATNPQTPEHAAKVAEHIEKFIAEHSVGGAA